MASIKPIEGRSVHQIQSGQVIVDLCSVVKELVENSIDAGATSVEVRFKNSGLDSIEVQDNGAGISPEDYATIALKHYTSKLSTYADLDSLQTYGFRGEALSSLCALSKFHIITARAQDAPKGITLNFETSGKLRDTQVVASQKGTTVYVENLFYNLPVRRRELEKNIKREYGKVLNLLNAYACISTGVKLTVSNQAAKGRKAVVFATKSNATTRENIANVFGAKTLPALIKLDLKLELEPTHGLSEILEPETIKTSKQVHVVGHISRPTFGEGRQTPDRQMFFVNGRPCGLPQVAKAINEVYKSFNSTQSPFILADLRMDTRSYDVNVSPDKRTILLHDQAHLLETLKVAITELFEAQDQTVPQAQLTAAKLPAFKQLTIHRMSTTSTEGARERSIGEEDDDAQENTMLDDDVVENSVEKNASNSPSVNTNTDGQVNNLISAFLSRKTLDRSEVEHKSKISKQPARLKSVLDPIDNDKKLRAGREEEDEYLREVVDSEVTVEKGNTGSITENAPIESTFQPDQFLEEQMTTASPERAKELESPIPSIASTPTRRSPGLVQSAFSRMRPKRIQHEEATVTIGSKTITSPIGSPAYKRQRMERLGPFPAQNTSSTAPTPGHKDRFSKRLLAFSAPGTQASEVSAAESEEEHDSEVEHSDAEDQSDERSSVNEDQGSEEPEDPSEQLLTARSGNTSEDNDDDYIDEKTKRAKEEELVKHLIKTAEEEAARPTERNTVRADTILQGTGKKNSTTNLSQTVHTSISEITGHYAANQMINDDLPPPDSQLSSSGGITEREDAAEERLSLTISKGDFERMRIIGQFNLGFILAVREGSSDDGVAKSDELFIIDQHASDEKYNFERLQAETVVQNQRLVKPRPLDLTAIEEEIILENFPALEKNGFIVEVDDSGDEPVGQRCKLISIPMSKEVVFDVRDLEELLALLAEYPFGSGSAASTRPSKVRKMFAMRACRSSIMIGKNLTHKQMEKVVRHMGDLDKPWNCPHGRPTMRHLMALDGWSNWQEGEGLAGLDDDPDERMGSEDWLDYINSQR